MEDVAFRGGRWVAVGFVGPDPWRPIAWSSDDADHWSLVEMADAPSDEADLRDRGDADGRRASWPLGAPATPRGLDVDRRLRMARHDVRVLGGPDDWERL